MPFGYDVPADYWENNQIGETPFYESNSMYMAAAALVMAGICYRMRNRKQADDEFVKVTDESNSIFTSLLNPFNRQNKKDGKK